MQLFSVRQKFVSLLSLQLLLLPFACPFSQADPSGSATSSALPAQAQSLHESALQLDLSSTEAHIEASNQSPVSIQVGGSLADGAVSGGSLMTVNPGQLLTAAQYFALNQVLNGDQTILLGQQGQALAGHSILDVSQIASVGSLHIPENVTLAAIGYNAASPLNVSGNVNILGSLYSLQTAANLVSVLNMGSLNIGSGALLSGELPAGMNFGNVFASAGMNLNVSGNIVNMGTITSPGSLNISAQGSISNLSSGNIAALISAQNVNLMSMSGQFINSGIITANANLNVNSLLNSDLVFENSGGLLRALGGSINIRDALFDAKQNLNLIGGDWLADRLNIYNGRGFAGINVDDISGTLNIDTGSVHLGSNGSSLNIGNFNVSGDPVIYNQGGSVTIGDTALAGADLILLAAGDITAGNITLSSSAGSRAGNLLAVGGAQFSVIAASASPPQQSLSGTAAAAGTSFEISGASGFSGNVTIGTISTRATAGGNGIAGNVDLVGFNGSVKSGAITSGGLGAAGSNGSVSIIAPLGISTGSINTSGAASATASGSISLVSAAPAMRDAGGSAANVIVSPENFGVNDYWTLTNRFQPDFNKLAPAANLSAGAMTTNGSFIRVIAGNDLSLSGTINASRTGAVSGNGGNIELIAGARASGLAGSGRITGNLPAISSNGRAALANTAASGGNITIASGRGGAIVIANNISAEAAFNGKPAVAANGGNVNIISASSITQNTGRSIRTRAVSPSGNSGNVFMAAGTNYNLQQAAGQLQNNLVLSGASGAGGAINLNGTAAIDTRSNATNGNGGKVQMAAFGGNITINNANNVDTGGRGSGFDGVFTAFSDSIAGNAVRFNSGDLTTVQSGGGMGHITIATAIPFNTNITIDPQAGSLSSDLSFNTANLVNGNLSLRGMTANGANIRAIAGNNLALANRTVSANRTIATGNGGNIELLAGARSTGAAAAGVITGLRVVSANAAAFGGTSAVGGNITIAGGSGLLNPTSNISANGAVNGSPATAGNGGNINIISAGTITQSGGTISANGVSRTGNGGKIFIASGTNWNIKSAANALGNTIEITGASGSAGSMTLNGGMQVRANTGGAGAQGNGGLIQLAAFNGGIRINNAASVQMAGRGSGQDGNFIALSNETAANAFHVNNGTLSTRSGGGAGTGGMGDLTIATALPFSSGFVLDPVSGALGSTLSLDLSTLVNGSIYLRGAGSNGGNIRVIAGNSLILNNGAVSASRVGITGNGGNVELLAGARSSGIAGSGSISGAQVIANGAATGGMSSKGGNITMAAGTGGLTITSNVQANGAVNGSPASAGSGGNVNIVSAGAITQSGGSITANGASLTGDGGKIFLSSGTNWNFKSAANALGNTIEITGASGTAGPMTLNGGLQVRANTGGATAQGNGGSIQLAAFAGGIRISNGSNVQMAGRGSGKDGSFIALSNETGANAFQVNSNALNTRSGTGAGNGGLGELTIATALPFGSGFSLDPATGALGNSLALDLSTLVDGSINMRGGGSNGGNVRLIAGNNLILNNAAITASRVGITGDGGNIELIAGARSSGTAGSGIVTGLRASANGIATAAGTSGKGGNITVASGSGGTLALGSALAANGAVNGAGNDGDGGRINIVSAAGITLNNTISLRGAGSKGDGGQLLLSSSTNYNLQADHNSMGNLLNLSGASASPANLNIAGAGIIDSRPAAAGAAGGDLQIGNFQGAISIANAANIRTAAVAAGSGNDGAVSLIGSGNINVTGLLRTSGGSTGTGGKISVATTSPFTSPISINPASGSPSANFSINESAVAAAANVASNGLQTNGADILILAGNNVNLGASAGSSILASRTNGSGSGGNIQVIAGLSSSGAAGSGSFNQLGAIRSNGLAGAGGNILLVSGSNPAQINSAVTANAVGGDFSGGNISIVSAGNLTVNSTLETRSAGAGSAASLFLASGAGWSLSSTDLSINPAASGANGSLQVSAPVNTSAQAAGGSGANLSLAAFGSAGTITAASSINLSGSAAGANGNLTAVAQANTAAAGNNSISFSQDLNTGSGAAGSGAIKIGTGAPLSGTASITRSLAAGPVISINADNTIANSAISTQALQSNGAPIVVIAAHNYTSNNKAITSSPASGSAQVISLLAGMAAASPGGPGTLNNLGSVSAEGTNGNGGSINLLGGTSPLTLSAAISSRSLSGGNGGAINIISAGDLSLSGPVNASGGAPGGKGGTVSIGSGAASSFDFASGNWQVLGQGSGGSLLANSSITSMGAAGGGDGGYLQMAAWGAGSSVDTTAAVINLGGTGSGVNGSLAAFAPSAVNLGTVNNSGGSGGGAQVLTGIGEALSSLAANVYTGLSSGIFSLAGPALAAGASSSQASGGGTSNLVLPLQLPGFVNTGTPTDRIFYNVNLSQQGSHYGQTLTLADRGTWLRADGPSQPILLDGDDSLVIGQEGSRLALVESRTLLLDTGRIAVLVGSNDLAVETGSGVLNMPAGGAFLLETKSSGSMQVLNLSGAPARFYLSASGKVTSIEIRQGEELLLASKNGEFAFGAGLERKSLALNAKVDGFRLAKNAVNPRRILEQERLLSCANGNDCASKSRVDALKSSLDAETKSGKQEREFFDEPAAGSADKSSIESDFKPIAFNPALPLLSGEAAVETLDFAMAKIKHQGAGIKAAGNRLELSSGEILVIARRRTIVHTGDSSLEIAPGTIALISKDRIASKVRNVWEPRAGSLRQILGRSHLEIAAGQECILTANQGALASVHMADSVGRRRLRETQIGQKHIATAEISLITLLTDSKLLRALMHSSDQDERKLTARVLKMAACIQAVTANHGSYTNFSSSKER